MENETQTTDATAISPEERGKIVTQCREQLRTSRQFKLARMQQIKENENLYYLIIEKSVRNPFNECYPFMSGFVDYLRSRIDDDSLVSFTHQAEADLKRAAKLTSLYEKLSRSIEPNDSWDLKHRHAKFNAILSGVAIYGYYSETTNGVFKSCLEVKSHYDFHCEPRGGAILENHLFCGEDNIFKTEQSLQNDSVYDKNEVNKLVTTYKNNGYKDNNDLDNLRNNRLLAMKQDPTPNNFVGQDTIKLVQWYTTYESKRYYVLFNEATGIAVRVCPIEDIFPSGLYPYVAWHTNEDGEIFWSKAPADDARGIAKIINTLINQELYNRQKRNYGKIIYDVDMFPNVQALLDWRPDGGIPANLMGGKQLNQGVYELKVGDLNGTLDLVTWLDQFSGKQIGRTSSSAGQAEADKKVGVFQGEIEQIDQLINVKNKSYRYALSCLALRVKQGLEINLTNPIAIKLMGAKGVEWETISKEDLKTEKDLIIQPIGGSSEMRLKQIKENKKSNTLALTQSVNPQWKDRELLLLAGYSEEEAKEAFSTGSFAQKELMSEAAMAEKEIMEGKTPQLNYGANADFMNHIITFATETDNISPVQHKTLIDYAMAHQDIALENMKLMAEELKRKKNMEYFLQSTPAPTAPTTPSLIQPQTTNSLM